MTRLFAVVAVSVLVGLGRFLIPGHDLSWAGTYEAMAHIWVGMLIALGWVDWKNRWPLERWRYQLRDVCWSSLGVITVLEVVMFTVRR